MKGLTFYGGWKYEKKDASFCSINSSNEHDVRACSYQKDEPQANAKGIAGKAVRSKLLT